MALRIQELWDGIPSAGQVSVAGIYIPSLLVYALAGFVAAYAVAYALQARGWGRHVWHMPLFFVALWFLITFSLGWILYPARLWPPG